MIRTFPESIQGGSTRRTSEGHEYGEGADGGAVQDARCRLRLDGSYDCADAENFGGGDGEEQRKATPKDESFLRPKKAAGIASSIGRNRGWSDLGSDPRRRESGPSMDDPPAPFLFLTLGGVHGFLPDVQWSMQSKTFPRMRDSGTVK